MPITISPLLEAGWKYMQKKYKEAAEPKPVKQTPKPSSNAGQALPDPKQYIKKFMGKNYGKMGEDQYTREIQKAWKNQYGTDLSDDVVSPQVQGALNYYANQAQAKPVKSKAASPPRDTIGQAPTGINAIRSRIGGIQARVTEKAEDVIDRLAGHEPGKAPAPGTLDSTLGDLYIGEVKAGAGLTNTLMGLNEYMPATKIMDLIIPGQKENRAAIRAKLNNLATELDAAQTPEHKKSLWSEAGKLLGGGLVYFAMPQASVTPLLSKIPVLGTVIKTVSSSGKLLPRVATGMLEGGVGNTVYEGAVLAGEVPDKGLAAVTQEAPGRLVGAFGAGSAIGGVTGGLTRTTPQKGSTRIGAQPSKARPVPAKTKVTPKPPKPGKATPNTLDTFTDEGLEIVNQVYENNKKYGPHIAKEQSNLQAHVKARKAASVAETPGQAGELSLGESVVGEPPTSPQASPKGAKTVEGVRKGEQARTQPKAQTKPVNPLWETKPGENLNQWADRLFDENKPRCEIRKPDRRHSIAGVKRRGKITPINSVFDPSVDIAADIKAIHEGLGKRNGNAVEINGREYRVKPGQNGKPPICYPTNGVGVNQLNPLERLALAIYNEYKGNTKLAQAELLAEGIPVEAQRKAFTLWQKGVVK